MNRETKDNYEDLDRVQNAFTRIMGILKKKETENITVKRENKKLEEENKKLREENSRIRNKLENKSKQKNKERNRVYNTFNSMWSKLHGKIERGIANKEIFGRGGTAGKAYEKWKDSKTELSEGSVINYCECKECEEKRSLLQFFNGNLV